MAAWFGRSLGTKLFGVKRRSRRLRSALERAAAGSALATSRASDPESAAHHDGARAAYVAALGRLSGGPESPPAVPPDDAALRRAWQHGYAAANDHARRMIDEIV